MNPNQDGTASSSLTISKTWDGNIPEHGKQIQINLSMLKIRDEDEGQNHTKSFLKIVVDAPFFDDPQIPGKYPPGHSTPGLWDYEVVELFFLGDDDKYLEIELGPHGHYLLLQLQGTRNIVQDSLQLDENQYRSEIHGERWTGTALIPLHYFPPNTKRMNAYAIHKADPDRVYMSLFPVDKGDGHTSPDFHRLQYFRSIEILEELSLQQKQDFDNNCQFPYLK